MTALIELLQIIFGRVFAAWFAGFCAWLMTRYGIQFTSADQQRIVEILVGFLLPTMLTVYSIVHKLMDKKLNPGDAASSHLAVQESNEAAVLKAKA